MNKGVGKHGIHIHARHSSKTLILCVFAGIAFCTIVATILFWLFGAPAHANVPPNDPLYAQQGNLAAMNVEAAWRAGYTGRGTKIAVIDSGVATHEDIDARRISGRSYVAGNSDDLTDRLGHGTFIAGTLAAKRDNGCGIAGMTDSEVVALRVVDESPIIGMADVAQAVRDAVDVYRCDVILMSLGTPNDHAELREAVAYADSCGAIIVAAAGGSEDVPLYPAAYQNVIGIGAVNTSFEPNTDLSVANGSVLVTAPATQMVGPTLDGGYAYDGAGASYAAAEVASFAAYAKQKDPSMTSSQFADLLVACADDRGDAGYDSVYGWGTVDAAALIGKLDEF